jgi:hypothetical protein
MTIPGVSAGSTSRNSRSASVPPVEAPTTTTFSVVFTIDFTLAFSRTASAVSLEGIALV